MTYQAKAAQYKKDNVAVLSKYMKEYPVVGIVNVENLPSKQLQVLRLKLRKDALITMSKKVLIRRAIESMKEKKGFDKLSATITGMPALLFTKQNPFKVSALIRASKSKAPAKAGQIAPYDLVIPAGPTSFTPGPIISELGEAGLKAGVENGKVVIKEAAVVAKQGEEITRKVVDILAKFNIEPMEIGLDLVAVYEDGLIYGKDVLSIDPAEYVDMIQSAAAEAFGLSVEVSYTNKDNIERLISKAFTTTKNFALDQNIMSDVVLEKDITNAERAAKSISDSANISDAAVEPEKAEETKSETDTPAPTSSEPEKETQKQPEVKKEEPAVEAKSQQPEVKKETTTTTTTAEVKEQSQSPVAEPKKDGMAQAEQLSKDFKEEIKTEKEMRDSIDQKETEELANQLKKKGTLRQ